ncbi:hypothetical protein CAPTEDRAFT_192206 [Capitella teleta]|uniref:Uncharacterized protein n=1 Tax=Capitella teleta TaxID=283909 RepID=R7TM70_CAPTE|nr:hypothetical protein CAPTEDRAFT_192206 [Capitella teleta]|eukprot:ELT94928.1 hypothetical protein CAPTEDRAFT_192206 [Capitella teleta]
MIEKTGSSDHGEKSIWKSSHWSNNRPISLGTNSADQKSTGEKYIRNWNEEDRHLNREADKCSVGLLPCSLSQEGYSVSFKNAKRLNRGQQKRLAAELSRIDRHSKKAEDNIVIHQKAIVDELLAEYPHLKNQICLLLLKDAPQLLIRLGLPRIRPREVDMKSRNSGALEAEPVDKRNDKLSLTGMKYWDGVSKSVKAPVTGVVSPAKPEKTTRTSKQRKKPVKPPLPKIDTTPTPEITVATGMTPSVATTPTTVREELETAASLAKDSLALPGQPESQISPTSGYFKFPTLTSGEKGVERKISQFNAKNIKVSHYVHSDFGFHQERMKPDAGMSTQKKFCQEKDVENSIAETAQKHINACQAASLRTRGSRAEQSIEDLKTLLHPGGSWKIKSFAKFPRVGSHSYGGPGLLRSKTVHQGRARIWPLPDISSKSLDHIARTVVVEKK